MAGNEYADRARERKVADLLAAANKFVTDVAGDKPDDRIVCLSALAGSLFGSYGPERQANDWDALLCVANRRSTVRHSYPSADTKAMVLVGLDRQLHNEQRASSPSAGLRAVK